MEKSLKKIVESLNNDLEEKIQQLSQVRLLAENIVAIFTEKNYYHKLCENLLDIFQGQLVALYWHRKNEQLSWWLSSWASLNSHYEPTKKVFKHEEEGLFGWVSTHQENLYLEQVEDEAILKYWSPELNHSNSIAFIPILDDSDNKGMIVLFNPYFKLSKPNIKIQMEIISSLIKSAIRNRSIYKNLISSESEFHDIFENSSDMILLLYPDGIICDFNRIALKKLTHKPSLAGDLFDEYICTSHKETYESAISELLLGMELNNVELELCSPIGEAIIVQMSGNVRFVQSGKPEMLRLYLHDITEQKKAERIEKELQFELLRQGQLAQVGLYLSGIIHNLQNPLAVVMGFSQLLKRKNESTPEIESIEKAAYEIEDIIQNTLNKVRKDKDSELSAVNINELLNTELKFLEANPYYKHKIQRSIELQEDLPEVKGLYSDFSQIIMNIVYNALDSMHSSEEKKLVISTKYNSEEKMVVVAISDSGPGIPKQLQSSIFDPFFTTKKDRKNVHNDITGGSGLGLASVMSLIKPYDGTITFDSIENQGTTFFISIPVKER